MNGFGDAPVKGSGSQVSYGNTAEYTTEPEKVPTTWLEFPLPLAWEDECYEMIKVWLKEKAIQDPINGAWK